MLPAVLGKNKSKSSVGKMISSSRTYRTTMRRSILIGWLGYMLIPGPIIGTKELHSMLV